jgi:predicted hydrocarbon binding protein
MRAQDVPSPDGLDEFHADLTTKRLGMSHTVSRQIDRYREMAAKKARADRQEVAALLQLAARRKDADLLFADAGRRAASRASEEVGKGMRRLWAWLPAFAGRRLGVRLAGRVLRGIFDVELQRDGPGFEARATEDSVGEATPDGGACAFYGSAIAATLREFTDFDGAVLHQECRANGASVCRWNTGHPKGTDS